MKVNTVGDRESEVDQALGRAVVYRTLSLGFRMPSPERLLQMGARDGFVAVAEALARLERQPSRPAEGRPRPLGLDSSAVAATQLTAFSLPDVETLATTFGRLFGHTTRGLICACETEYGADNAYHQPQQLADISGDYLAFGLRAATASDVRADHVACECEFMDFMNRKEAFFLATSTDGETLDVTRRASRAFLRDHLGRFGRAFAARVMAEDSEGYFGILGTILFELLESECERLGLTSGLVDLAVRQDVPDRTPMACGTPSELIQIQRRR